MNREEYEKFMEFLFEEHVRRRSSLWRPRYHPFEWSDKFGWEWERTKRAAQITRFISRHCHDEDEIYRIFSKECIKQLPDDVARGLRLNDRLCEDFGFKEIADSYFVEICEGMVPEHMPPEETDILKELGSNNPETEIAALMHIAKSEAEKRRSYRSDEISTSRQLKNIQRDLEELAKKSESNNKIEEEPKKPRWFKGIGQIAQGSALSIANVGLAVGAWSFPASPSTATWGSIVSSITGVGVIMKGIGDLRGE